MEIHHHSHGSHGKKNWRSYVWEFLMLFLAVFCGFLAEYQLEHMIEHQREKKYVQSLIEDLKTDQVSIDQHVNSVNKGLLMMDSMIHLLNSPVNLAANSRYLYYWARLAPRLNPLTSNTRTFEQLKNSGSFRLIRNLDVSNRIMAYYEMFPLEHLLETVNETEFNEYKKIASKIFEPSEFLAMEGANDEIIMSDYNPAIRNTDKELLKEFAVFAVYLHGTKKGIIGNDLKLKKAGAELIEYLEQDYHLK
jgi:hypothetical protein